MSCVPFLGMTAKLMRRIVSAGKEKKKVDKQVANEQAAAQAAFSVSPEELRAALTKIRTEDVPKTSEEGEMYFTTNLNLGEKLVTQGQHRFLPRISIM